jgi:hypothetical protein
MKKRSNVLNSPRLKEIKRKKYVTVRNKILLYIVFFFILIASLSFLSRWQEINIVNIEISGNKIIETKNIASVLESNLSGKYLFFFPKTNFIIYPKNQIKDDLTSRFNRLKDIKLTIEDTKNLRVDLSERIASYTWCGDNLPTDNLKLEESKCYFMDDSGYVFDEAPYFSGEIYFRFFGKISKDTDSPLGSIFLQNDLMRLISFKDEVSKTGIKPASFFIKDNNDIELYLSSNIAPPNAPKIIFKKDSDLKKLAENLQVALMADPLKTDIDKKYSSLLYIDLRFGNKVYYKFKND